MGEKIKPLARPGWTMFNNYILDHIMPDLSPNAWKVLCVAIRRTIGWIDESTETGRKEQDAVSIYGDNSGRSSGRTIAAEERDACGRASSPKPR